jgi:hypothetical protein
MDFSFLGIIASLSVFAPNRHFFAADRQDWSPFHRRK